jgi:hypothetical protein
VSVCYIVVFVVVLTVLHCGMNMNWSHFQQYIQGIYLHTCKKNRGDSHKEKKFFEKLVWRLKRVLHFIIIITLSHLYLILRENQGVK